MKMMRLLAQLLVASSVVFHLDGFGIRSLASTRTHHPLVAQPLCRLFRSRRMSGGLGVRRQGGSADSAPDSSLVEKLRKQASGAKKKQQLRATRVRQKLNLPLDYGDGDRVDALNAAARSIMTSMCLAEEYDTAALVESMPGNAILVGDVAAVGLPRNFTGESHGPPIAFVFPYGSVVLWGFTEDESTDLIDKAAAFAEGTLPAEMSAAAEDRIAFFPMVPSAAGAVPVESSTENYLGALGERSTGAGTSAATAAGGLAGKLALNASTSSTAAADDATAAAAAAAAAAAVAATEAAAARKRPGVSFARTGAFLNLADVQDPLAKLSVSYAFAQSSKLNTFEYLIDELVEDIRPIPEALAKFGKVKYSQTDAARLTGRTFLLSSAVNLYSDILDVPDFFWENDQYEPLYTRANSYLDVDDRTSITNSRLNVVGELLDKLGGQLAIDHANELEWIIIWLIVIEVLFELPHVPFGKLFSGIKSVGSLMGMA